MKNLIDEIEKKKTNIDGFTASDYGEGYLECVDEILELLNQYNIITAPKQIKLSEIVEKLEEDYISNDSKVSLRRHDNEIDVWEDYKISDDEEQCNGSTFILKINNKIDVIGRDIELKWLYTLWIAGTIIEDDLEEE